jgi:hypothetical protein
MSPYYFVASYNKHFITCHETKSTSSHQIVFKKEENPALCIYPKSFTYNNIKKVVLQNSFHRVP